MQSTKSYWRQRFAKVGVAPEFIFSEILRARKIDQVLFANPGNRSYGVGEEDIIQAMEEVTQEEFGAFSGPRERYISVFETAMAAPPLLFADFLQRSQGTASLLAWWRRHQQSRRILLVGAESFLASMPDAQRIFSDGLLTVAVEKDTTAQAMQLIYPYCEWCTYERIPAHDYDYLYARVEPAKSLQATAVAWQQVGRQAVRTMQISPTDWQHCSFAENASVYWQLGSKVERIFVEADPDKSPVYGEARFRQGSWILTEIEEAVWQERIHVPAHSLQEVATVLGPVRQARQAELYYGSTAVGWPIWTGDEDTAPQRESRQGILLREGDIVLAMDQQGYRCSYVAAADDLIQVCGKVTVFRPREKEMGYPLWRYLESRRGRDAVEKLVQGKYNRLHEETWLRLEVPAYLPPMSAGERESQEVYLNALRAWRGALKQQEEV